MTFMKIYFKIKNYLIIVIIQKIVRSFFMKIKKKVIGLVKDEAARMPIKEFIGLGSKMYSHGTDPTKLFSKIKELTEDAIEDIKKCETLKKYTSTKITLSKFGSALYDSILKKSIDVKELKETTIDQVKKYFIYESKKCKGISKHNVKKGFTINDYVMLFLVLQKKKKKKKKKTLYEIN